MERVAPKRKLECWYHEKEEHMSAPHPPTELSILWRMISVNCGKLSPEFLCSTDIGGVLPGGESPPEREASPEESRARELELHPNAIFEPLDTVMLQPCCGLF